MKRNQEKLSRKWKTCMQSRYTYCCVMQLPYCQHQLVFCVLHKLCLETKVNLIDALQMLLQCCTCCYRSFMEPLNYSALKSKLCVRSDQLKTTISLASTLIFKFTAMHLKAGTPEQSYRGIQIRVLYKIKCHKHMYAAQYLSTYSSPHLSLYNVIFHHIKFRHNYNSPIFHFLVKQVAVYWVLPRAQDYLQHLPLACLLFYHHCLLKGLILIDLLR